MSHLGDGPTPLSSGLDLISIGAFWDWIEILNISSWVNERWKQLTSSQPCRAWGAETQWAYRKSIHAFTEISSDGAEIPDRDRWWGDVKNVNDACMWYLLNPFILTLMFRWQLTRVTVVWINLEDFYRAVHTHDEKNISDWREANTHELPHLLVQNFSSERKNSCRWMVVPSVASPLSS